MSLLDTMFLQFFKTMCFKELSPGGLCKLYFFPKMENIDCHMGAIVFLLVLIVVPCFLCFVCEIFLSESQCHHLSLTSVKNFSI